MEGYNHQMSDNVASGGGGGGSGFLYGGGPVNPPSSSMYGRNTPNSGHHHSQLPPGVGFNLHSGVCFDHEKQHPVVKAEAASHNHHQSPKFHYSSGLDQSVHQGVAHHNYFSVDALKARIVAHPQYSNLLQAYMDCQKVGAPPAVVARLRQVRQDFGARQRATVGSRDEPKDPELDQFMEAYYDMLVKYREELTRPLQEAMEFMQRIETQLSMITNAPIRILNSDENYEGGGSSEDDQDNSGGERIISEIDPRAEDRELKNHLLKKYSGYLSSLKHELSKKKKKGKLPKEARHKLLSWWELHYKWPYPSELEKVALAEDNRS